MDSFTFVATELKVNKTTVRYTGVYTGVLPIKGDKVELLGIENVRRPVKITSVKDAVDLKCIGNEKAAEISIVLLNEAEPSVFDVMTENIGDLGENENDENDKFGNLPLTNRRLEALIWKYQNDNDVDTLGAIAEYITFASAFYIEECPIKKEGHFYIPTLEKKNKHRFYPVFTSLTEITKNAIRPGSTVRRIGFDGIVKLLHADRFANGIIVNPWSMQLTFTRADFAKMKKLKELVETDSNETDSNETDSNETDSNETDSNESNEEI